MIVRSLTGANMEQALPALARLRISVFRSFPYLYAGTEDYEQDYLRSFGTALPRQTMATLSDAPQDRH